MRAVLFLNPFCPRPVTPDSQDSAGQAPDSYRTQGLCHCSRYAGPATLSDVNREIAQPQLASPTRAFTVLFSPTRRGARLARLLATAHLGDWGIVPGPFPRKTVWAELDLVR